MGMLIAVVVVLALLGGVLGTLLEVALWSVLLMVLAIAAVGVVGLRALTGAGTRRGRGA